MPKSSSSLSLSRKIAKCTELNHQKKLLEEQIESLKNDIRAEAKRCGLGHVASPIEFDCKLGVCSVAHVSDYLAIAKGCDARDLKNVISIATWNELFVEQVRVEVRPGALKVYEKMTAPERKASSKILEYKEGTPRVTLPKMP